LAQGAEAVVMIRPRGLRLAENNEFGTEGRIVEARFLGDELQLGVVFEGFDEPWLARIAARQDVNIGATLKFAADPAHVFVFEA
jgi:ABC-type sugar transport system ATPase subunit